jgi:thiamine pyrophosphate-dependent acetolactate synthase large subunit-like protein
MESVVYKRPIAIAGIARAMGLAAWSVEQPGQIAPALREALATAGPAVIEIRTDPEVRPPLGPRAKAIAGFRDK